MQENAVYKVRVDTVHVQQICRPLHATPLHSHDIYIRYSYKQCFFTVQSCQRVHILDTVSRWLYTLMCQFSAPLLAQKLESVVDPVLAY